MNRPVLALLTLKALASFTYAAPMTLSAKVPTSVSSASALVPTLAAVMLRLCAVMSMAASPSSTAPGVVKVTLWPVAVRLPTVRSPALKVTVTAPVAVTLCRFVAPPALSVNRAVLALLTLKALASFTYAAPVTLSAKVPTSVSSASVLVPTLVAVMLKVCAVMSTSSVPLSPSSTEPAARRSTEPLACTPIAPRCRSPDASTKLPCRDRPSNTLEESGWACKVASGSTRCRGTANAATARPSASCT